MTDRFREHNKNKVYITSNRLGADSQVYVFETITEFEDDFTKSITSVPIVTLPTDCTFALESSASLKYTFQFVRQSPFHPDDNSSNSSLWSNATWQERVSSLVNRWQARQDGYTMDYRPEPDSDGEDSTHLPNLVSEHVYINKISFNIPTATPEVISGSVTVTVGCTTYNRNDRTVRTKVTNGAFNPIYPISALPTRIGEQDYMISQDEGRIVIGLPIADENNPVYQDITFPPPTNLDTIPLGDYDLQNFRNYNTEKVKDWEVDKHSVSIVDKYTLTGGPSEPFERLQMTFSTKQLGGAAIGAYKGWLKLFIQGRSHVHINLVGHSSRLIVSDCSIVSNDKVKIVAYDSSKAIVDINKGNVAFSALRNNHPGEWITAILTEYCGYTEDKIIKNVDLTAGDAKCMFEDSATLWDILQLCAAYFNARVFFANDRVYLIDYERLRSYDGVYVDPGNDGIYELYPTSNEITSPFKGNVTDRVDFSSNTGASLINSVDVKYRKSSDGSNIEEKTIIRSSSDSKQVYSTCAADLSLNDYVAWCTESFAQRIGDYIISYRAEPQSTAKIELKERVTTGNAELNDIYWVPMFPNVCAASAFYSSVDEHGISCYSTIRSGWWKPQLTMLSQFVRNYPEFTTTYTFGELKQLDLANTIVRSKV